jgi:hypothetical protein
MFGSEKRTHIEDSKKSAGEFQVRFDSTGQRVMCTGGYVNDEKRGIWIYYSSSGYVLHKFDHSTGQLIQNNLREANNNFVTFLGGPERFQNYYFTAQQEIDIKPPIEETSEVEFEVDSQSAYVFRQGYGSDAFRKQVDQILRAVPPDWIWLDLNSPKKLCIVSKVTYTPNTFARYNFSLEFKTID